MNTEKACNTTMPDDMFVYRLNRIVQVLKNITSGIYTQNEAVRILMNEHHLPLDVAEDIVKGVVEIPSP
jgi:hypothetical protein